MSQLSLLLSIEGSLNYERNSSLHRSNTYYLPARTKWNGMETKAKSFIWFAQKAN